MRKQRVVDFFNELTQKMQYLKTLKRTTNNQRERDILEGQLRAYDEISHNLCVSVIDSLDMRHRDLRYTTTKKGKDHESQD